MRRSATSTASAQPTPWPPRPDPHRFSAQSGKSRALRRAFGGDKALERVFFQSAFCAVTTEDPVKTAFLARKRREGERHNQAIIALARRRVTVLWTMIRRGRLFEPMPHAA